MSANFIVSVLYDDTQVLRIQTKENTASTLERMSGWY